jgi:hypothetical protein
MHRERARVGSNSRHEMLLGVVPAIDVSVFEIANMEDDRAVTVFIASIERFKPSSSSRAMAARSYQGSQ